MSKKLMLVENTVIEGHLDEYLAAATAFADDASEHDAGCLGMCAYVCEANGRVLIASLWEDEASMNASTSFARHKAALKPHFAGNTTSIYTER